MSSLEDFSDKERAFVEFARRAFGDPVEAPAFLLSFKNFAAGLNLFQLWVQEFERVSSQQVQRTRLLEFLHCWMSAYPTDLTSREHKRILALLSTPEHQDETVISEFKRLISLENTTKLKRLISRQAQSSSTSPSASPSTSSEDVKSISASPPGSAIVASHPLGFPAAASTSTGSQPLSPNPKSGRQRGASMRNWLNRGRKNTGDLREMASISSPGAEGRDGASRIAQAPDSSSIILREETDFLAQGSIDIARELTMIEFEIFKNIGSRELLNQCWQKENKNVTAPFITKLIAKFNEVPTDRNLMELFELEVSYWVATEILSRADPREQARVISKFIKIARLCYQLYNYNSLSEILTGLNNSAVIRLKVAWMCVPDRSMKQFLQLDQLMQPQANYLHYRHEIRRLTFTKRDRRPTGNVPTPSGLSTVSSDSALQTSVSLDELIPSSARGPQPTEPPTSLRQLSSTTTTTPSAPPTSNSSSSPLLPTSTPVSALPTVTSSPSSLSAPTSTATPATSPLSLTLPSSSNVPSAAVGLSPLSPSSRSRLTDYAIDCSAPALRPTTPEPQISGGDSDATDSSPSPQLPTSPPSSPVVKRVANLRDSGSGGEGTVATQDRTSFLPRAPLSPKSPRSQWTVEIGLSRDPSSPRSERASATAATTTTTATNSEEKESDGKVKERAKATKTKAKAKKRLSGGDALPRQEALHLINTDRAGQAEPSPALAEKALQEGKDKYFLTELGASTRALVGDRTLPVLSLPPPGSSLSNSVSSGQLVPSSPSPSLSLLSSSSSLSSHSSLSSSSPFSASSPFSSPASGGSSNVFVARGIPPILPYLAIILRDFIAVSEGNAAYTSEGWINSHLIDLQYQIVAELKNFQANSYSLPRKESARRYLDTLQYEDDDDILYSMSLKSCPIAQPLEGLPHGESSLNPDTAQEYFEAAMKTDSVSEVLSREDNASSVTTAALQPRPMVRERNASIAFYAMLSQGTAGMLEREMNHFKVYDTPSPSPLASSSPLSRKMSSGGSCIVFRGPTVEPWNTEIVLSSASESDSQPLELSTPDTSDRDEREGSLIIGGSGSGSGVHESLSSALLGVAAGGHSKGRPKSLQPWSSGELDVAGASASSLRDRSNSATTEQQKQHDDEQNRRRLGQLQKKRNGKNNSGSGHRVHQAHHARGRHKNERTGSFDDTTLRSGYDNDGDDDDDDDIDVIRERPAQVEESSDGDQRAALTGSRGGSNGGGAKRVKSLKHLKERILSFRGKVDLGSSSGGSSDGSSPHHQHQRSNSTGTTSLPSPTPQSTARKLSSSTTRTSSTTSSTTPPAAGGSDTAPTPKATESASDAALPNNNASTSNQIAAATTKEQTKAMKKKKKRKKQGRKAKSPAAEAQGTTSGGHQTTATSSPPAQETPPPLVANRPAVVTRDRQGSVAFYAELGQGASVLLAESVYKPLT